MVAAAVVVAAAAAAAAAVMLVAVVIGATDLDENTLACSRSSAVVVEAAEGTSRDVDDDPH